MVNGGFFPMGSLAADPLAARLMDGLAGLGRLILFDRRGVGLSDPVSDWDAPLREQWADDLAAVIVASGCEQPTVFSWQAPSPVARTCAIRHPGLIGRLVLLNPATAINADDRGWVAAYVEGAQRMRRGGAVDAQSVLVPGRQDDPAFLEWFDAAGRAGASPSQADRLSEKSLVDPRFDNSQIATPTLVITRVPEGYVVPAEFFERTAHEIPGAAHVALAPGDMFPFGVGVDDLLAAISQYVVGEVRLPPPERQIAVILFTDLVGSTRRAISSGDAAWKQLLDHHDAVSRDEVSRRSGQVIKTTGDGILAILPSATAAIQAAQAIRAGLDEDDLAVRIGIHVGEIDRRGDDVSGLAVNITARIMATAESGQILVSAVVNHVTELALVEVGPRALKDIDGTWVLHAVE